MIVIDIVREHTHTQCTRVICISILLSFLLNLPPLHAQQLNICGTPESTTEEILAARSLISLFERWRIAHDVDRLCGLTDSTE